MVRKLESYLAERTRIAEDDSDLTSRSDLRRDRIKSETQFFELAEALCRISDKRLKLLELDPHVLELIDSARRIESPAARDRALRRVRKELRHVDVELLKRRIGELDHPSAAKAPRPETTWASRLASEQDPALDAFVSEYPNANRSQLRTLVRNVSKASEAERNKNLSRLAKAIGEAIADSNTQSVAAPSVEPEEDAAETPD